MPDLPADYPFRAGPGRRHPHHPALRWVEQAVLFHLGGFIVGTSWAFGGQSPGARDWVQLWGTIGLILFFRSLAVLEFESAVPRRRAWSNLWPLLVFDALALAGLANPTLTTILRDNVPYFMLVDPPCAWLPSCARPDLALTQLWMLNGIVVSAYNAFLVLRSRRQLRQLLLLMGGNGVVLAVFGTFQRLAHAPGIYFGLVETPQDYFFSSFVYHNHWGAFTLLNFAACLGLFFHTLRQAGLRHPRHSPALGGAVALLLLAASVPLSASRSGTVLMGILAGGALLHGLRRLLRRQGAHPGSVLLPAAGVTLTLALALGGIGYLARDVIAQRARLTSEQIEQARHSAQVNSRLVLYRDTCRMASIRPWFGWGLESYGDVFRIYNSQRSSYDGVRYWQPYYRAAHSDGLQSWAENGLIGTTLIGLLGLLPLRHVRWRRVTHPIPLYLLAGCALLLLYAGVEFPFANPSVLLAFWTSLYVAARYATLDEEPRPEEASP